MTFNALSLDEKEIWASAMLCRRILQIDPTENDQLGCPSEYVAFPMLRHFLRDRKGWTPDKEPHDYLLQMLYSDGQGRSCEISEIQYWAQKYLDEVATF